MESWITFNTQSKITLFYNLHMVESLPPPEWLTQRNKFEIIFRLKGEEPVWPNLTLEGLFYRKNLNIDFGRLTGHWNG